MGTAAFWGVVPGDVRRGRRVVTLAAGWAREPGATIPPEAAGLTTTEIRVLRH